MPADVRNAPASLNFGAASAQVALTMEASKVYVVTATAACWIAVDANPTAVAHNAGNMYIPANYPILISCFAAGTKIAAIQDAAAGFLSVAPYV